MYDASSIGLIIVKRAISERAPITQMKLQKMVFFAQGYHLAAYDKPLIIDEIQAWKFGPVIPALYNDYKFYGSNPIDNLSWVPKKLTANFEALNSEAKNAIDITWKVTKDKNGLELSNWTHKEGSPWQKCYIKGVSDIPIPNDIIKTYFKDILNTAPTKPEQVEG